MIYNNNFILLIIFLSLFISELSSSGAYDHGSSTGKGNFQVDITVNPFNIFEHGQSYVVLSYGITEKFDINGYYADHGNYNNGIDSYYLGLFYQFYNSTRLDLATAIGKRKMLNNNNNKDIFFPQLLYNFKFKKDYSIGGSLVNVRKENIPLLKKNNDDWLAFDIALFIPIKKFFHKYKKIESVKIGLGLFKSGLNNSNISRPLMPTYSIDIKFKIN